MRQEGCSKEAIERDDDADSKDGENWEKIQECWQTQNQQYLWMDQLWGLKEGEMKADSQMLTRALGGYWNQFSR